jgi:5-methylcytosine-specific restriction endonuclease McrA
MKVFVLSITGKPLMPTTPRRARLWLKSKRAQVVRSAPFTIRLTFATSAYTQPVKVGVDTGSQTVGIAATTQGEVIYQAGVHLRNDISSKLTQRRQYRRTRRSRKTRYRAARFANRCRKPGWLPPSLRSKAEATIKAVRFVAALLPICQINVEIGSFDTQKIQDPEISGLQYQQGELQGYLVREYLLTKWQRQCAYCQKSGMPLQIEHLVPKSRGGSDRVSNLVIACEACNVRKGKQTAAEFGYPHLQALARLPLKDAAHVSTIKTALVTSLQAQFGVDHIRVTYGYETKYQRIQVLNLPKSHTNDAIAVACAIGEVVKPSGIVYQARCIARGNYQLYNGKHSEHRVWAPRKVKGWKLFEVVEAKGQIGYIGGRRLTGAFVIKEVATGKTLLEVTPRKLRRLARPQHSLVIVNQPSGRKEERASSSV